MSEQWFCVIDGKRRGPMRWDVLQELARSHALAPTDLIWEPSFGSTWREASKVDGLFDVLTDEQPAIATHIVQPQETTSAPPQGVPSFKSEMPPLGVEGEKPSIAKAINGAWDHMVGMLFKPFDITLWFSIGLCAWLATLGQGGGGRFKIPYNNDTLVKKLSLAENHYAAGADQNFVTIIKEFYDSTIAPAIELYTVIAVFVILLVIAIKIVVMFLQSRGTFMLIHRWHYPDDTVKNSWSISSDIWRSLFWWRLVFGFCMFLLMSGVLVSAVITILIPFLRTKALAPDWEIWAIGLSMALLLVLGVWGAVALLLDGFVVPVMYWRRVGVLDAWRVVLSFCNYRAGSVTLFFIVYPLLGLACLSALMLITLLTCCILLLPLALPYVGAVVTLPITIFMRGISINFLKQWRPDLAQNQGRIL